MKKVNINVYITKTGRNKSASGFGPGGANSRVHRQLTGLRLLKSFEARALYMLLCLSPWAESGREGGGGGAVLAFLLLYKRTRHPTFFSYRCVASHAQFWRIPLPGSSQIPNSAPRFFSEIPDRLPDPVWAVFHWLVTKDSPGSGWRQFFSKYPMDRLVQFTYAEFLQLATQKNQGLFNTYCMWMDYF